jgi:hypothetical protein
VDERKPGDLSRDPERDTAVEGALRAAYGEPPGLDPPDVEAFHHRLLVAARGRVGAREARATWWSCLHAWTRAALPAGVAACVVLLVGLVVFDPTRAPVSTGPATLGSDGDSPAEDLVASRASEDPAAALLAAETSADFLAAVLDYRDAGEAGVEQ